jgi:hypothetical protein
MLSFHWRPSQIWYRLKCFLWHRYTTIKSRYLDHTWHNRVTVLPYTMFEILSNFIEGECSPGHVDWEGSGHTVEVNGETINVRDEMQELYDWWHTVYNKEFDEVNEILWKEAEKHSPTELFIPYEPEGEDENLWETEPAEMFIPCDPGDELEKKAEWMTYDPQFKNEEDGEIYHRCLIAANKLEYMQSKMLMERMHRLVNLTPYLWT